MKKNKRLLRRLCPLFLVVLLIVPVAIPASAVAYDYNDLPHSVTVDGSNDVVTVSLDPSMGNWFYKSYGDPQSELISGNSVILPADYLEYVQFEFFQKGSGLDPSNIPDGTAFTVVISATLDHASYNDHSFDFRLHLQNYNQNWGFLNQSSGDLVDVPGFLSTTITLTSKYVSNAASVYLFPVFDVNELQIKDPLTFKVVSCSLTMSISSLFRQQQLTGKTNKLLGEVEKQLEANGQKLDDILQSQQNAQEYIPQVSAPPVQGDLDNLQGVEDNLMNDVNAGFDKAHEYQEAAGGVITSLYIPLMAVSSLLSQLIGLDTSQIPGFYQILMVSMGLGLVGVLLNLGVNYVRSKAGDH